MLKIIYVSHDFKERDLTSWYVGITTRSREERLSSSFSRLIFDLVFTGESYNAEKKKERVTIQSLDARLLCINQHAI